MKYYWCIFLAIIQLKSFSQDKKNDLMFQEVKNGPFFGVGNAAIDAADIDSDGDLDILLTGENGWGLSEIGLYINDGNGLYKRDSSLTFTSVKNGTADFADIDNDGDPDLLITGFSVPELPKSEIIAEIYLNKGQGKFERKVDTSIGGIYDGDVEFFDYDNDQDQDLIVAGISGRKSITHLYENDGNGNFKGVEGVEIELLNRCTIAVADVDGDKDQDFFIAGRANISVPPKSLLYINDGKGSFSVDQRNLFVGVFQSDAKFADLDGDNDLDLLLIGLDKEEKACTRLYENLGEGQYRMISNTAFQDLFSGAIAYSDVDADGDLDVLLTGDKARSPVTELYMNEGSFNFKKIDDISLFPVLASEAIFLDMNGDKLEDIILTGFRGMHMYTKVYFHQGK